MITGATVYYTAKLDPTDVDADADIGPVQFTITEMGQ